MMEPLSGVRVLGLTGVLMGPRGSRCRFNGRREAIHLSADVIVRGHYDRKDS
jgi:hypothetical protein